MKSTWGVRKERRHWSCHNSRRVTVVHIATREGVWVSSRETTLEEALVIAMRLKVALEAANLNIETKILPRSGPIYEAICACVDACEAVGGVS